MYYRVIKKSKDYNLNEIKNDVIDKFESTYVVDENLQRRLYFDKVNYVESIGVMEQLFEGTNLDALIFVNLKKQKYWYGHHQINKNDIDYKYFSQYWDKYNWLSTDGNNRTHGIYWFFTDRFRLPQNFLIPLLVVKDGVEIEELKPIPHEMNHSELISYYGEEYTNSFTKINTTVVEVEYCSKSQLHKSFRNVNKNRKLERQEDRNVIDQPIADKVREISKTNKTFLQSNFTKDSLRTRTEESWIAFSLLLIQEHYKFLNENFNVAPNDYINESKVTECYENNDINDKTYKIFEKKILPRIKTYVKVSGDTKFLSRRVFSLALVSWFYRLTENYSSIKWRRVIEEFDKYFIELTNDTTHYFPYDSGKEDRTFSDWGKSGIQKLSFVFSFFVNLELKLLDMGLMYDKFKRQDTTKYRHELFIKQNKICPLTQKEIKDPYNTEKWQVDHIIPITKWNNKTHKGQYGEHPNNIKNYQLVDRKANGKKSNKIENE